MAKLRGIFLFALLCNPVVFTTVRIRKKASAVIQTAREKSWLDEHVEHSVRMESEARDLAETRAELSTVSEKEAALLKNGGEADVKILLKAGDSNEPTNYKHSLPSLHDAAYWSQITKVRFLTNLGAKIDAADEFGQTPLGIAASEGHDSMVTLLVQKRANVEARSTVYDFYGGKWLPILPLQIASLKNKKEAATVLIESGADIDATEPYGETPLGIAVSEGLSDMMTLLLEKKANVEAQSRAIGTELPKSPLQLACLRNKTEIVRALLQEGADANGRGQGMEPGETKQGRAPVFLAVLAGHERTVNLLVEHRAELNTVFYNGQTPLQDAVQSANKIDVVHALISGRAELNVRSSNENGKTALQYAAGSNLETAQALIAARAELNSEATEGKTALQYAAGSHVKTTEALIAAKVEPNAKATDGKTALHYAVGSHVDVVKALIAASADFRVCDKDDITPFGFAASKCIAPPLRKRCKKDILEALIAAGANLNTERINGQTVVDVAEEVAKEKGHTEAVQYLLEQRAEVSSVVDLAETN